MNKSDCSNFLLLSVVIVTVSILPVGPIALADSESNIVIAQATPRVIKQVTCPREIKVSSTQNTGDWEIPATPAQYVSVEVKKREYGNAQHYSVVCYYSAFIGKIPIEQDLGHESRFRLCEAATVGPRGGAKCYE